MTPLELSQTEVGEKTLASRALDPPMAIGNVSGLKLGLVAAILLALLALGVVGGLIPRWRQRTALRAETHELAISTVTVVSPAAGKAAEGLTLPAEVKSFMEASIYARANGYLKRWLVDLGA